VRKLCSIIASYAQESTRYCNYSNDKFGDEITVIEPSFFDKSTANYSFWNYACINSEKCYFAMLESGATPQ
jgi:thymidylate synthase (FAD)